MMRELTRDAGQGVRVRVENGSGIGTSGTKNAASTGPRDMLRTRGSGKGETIVPKRTATAHGGTRRGDVHSRRRIERGGGATDPRRDIGILGPITTPTVGGTRRR